MEVTRSLRRHDLSIRLPKTLEDSGRSVKSEAEKSSNEVRKQTCFDNYWAVSRPLSPNPRRYITTSEVHPRREHQPLHLCDSGLMAQTIRTEQRTNRLNDLAIAHLLHQQLNSIEI
jgi:hypothetical protein